MQMTDEQQVYQIHNLYLARVNLEKVQKKKGNQIVAWTQKNVYTDRLKSCKLPSLHYRRIQGDMIEIYIIVSGKYDSLAAPVLPGPHSYVTRGHDLRLQK